MKYKRINEFQLNRRLFKPHKFGFCFICIKLTLCILLDIDKNSHLIHCASNNTLVSFSFSLFFMSLVNTVHLLTETRENCEKFNGFLTHFQCDFDLNAKTFTEYENTKILSNFNWQTMPSSAIFVVCILPFGY